MLTLKTTAKFRKDYKLAKKRGFNLLLLEKLIDTLLQEQPLDMKFCDHELSGQYKGFRECHIQPDWLLIYRIEHKQAVLVASRTGTHTDLF